MVFRLHLFWIYFLHQNTWFPQPMSTTRRAGKNKHLFFKTPPSGCFYANNFNESPWRFRTDKILYKTACNLKVASFILKHDLQFSIKSFFVLCQNLSFLKTQSCICRRAGKNKHLFFKTPPSGCFYANNFNESPWRFRTDKILYKTACNLKVASFILKHDLQFSIKSFFVLCQNLSFLKTQSCICRSRHPEMFLEKKL